jgi:large subunit ribosomal protein L6
MLIISKKKKKNKHKIYFNSILGNIQIFFIDKIIKIPTNTNIYLKNKKIFFKGAFGILLINIETYKQLNVYKYKKQLILILQIYKKKKSMLHLYSQLFIIKIKGISKNFKSYLLLKGIGFKALILNNNILQLKIGYSHVIDILIPNKIQMFNQSNILIFNSNDFIELTQFIHSIKKLKKPEPYKGKGLLLKNEIILLKEGKKSKK